VTRRKKDRTRFLIKVLIAVTAVAVCVTVGALIYLQSRTVLAPEYAPHETEQNAETIENDDEDKLEQPEGGGAVSLTYSTEVTIDLSEKQAALHFANPGKSNQDMIVQLVIEDTEVIQSGLLKPGNQVTKLDLLDGAGNQLTAGKYEGKFVVLYYQQDTGEKAMVNTEIPVTITVQD
jgi:hypothetical protein